MASFIVRQLLAFVVRLLWVLPDAGIWGEHTQEEGFLGDTVVKNPPAGFVGSFPGLGRSPGEGNGNPLQYSCLENSMERGAWWVIVHGVAESDMTEHASHVYTHTHTHTYTHRGGQLGSDHISQYNKLNYRAGAWTMLELTFTFQYDLDCHTHAAIWLWFS